MTADACERTVLVVEDDSDIREALAQVLEDGHYRAIRAANGEVALATLRDTAFSPCVILLDVMMPVMDGREFLLRKQEDAALSQIPVVVLSAQADAARAATQLNAAGFLKKPIDLAELLRTVEKFCGKV
jgi:two-component system response regulator MprA